MWIMTNFSIYKVNFEVFIWILLKQKILQITQVIWLHFFWEYRLETEIKIVSIWCDYDVFFNKLVGEVYFEKYNF